MSEIINKLNYAKVGSAYKTLKNKLQKENINIDELSLRSSIKVSSILKINQNKVKIPDEKLFCINSKYCRNIVKSRILLNKLMPYECNICHLKEWMEKPISLHLDHINGTRDDNRMENLRLICPNCHSQTSTYAGKNKHREIKKCLICEMVIRKSSKKCRSCCSKEQATKISWPETKILLEMTEIHGYSYYAKILGVSDNAIRKRIRNHPVPIQ